MKRFIDIIDQCYWNPMNPLKYDDINFAFVISPKKCIPFDMDCFNDHSDWSMSIDGWDEYDYQINNGRLQVRAKYRYDTPGWDALIPITETMKKERLLRHKII